ncbi:hypothetical protein MMC30_007474 [Trapelia coarctata]|nr:hypothetical protein [Trapelia coarctata]
MQYVQDKTLIPDRATVLRSAKAHVWATGEDAWSEDDEDWVRCLRRVGMVEEVCEMMEMRYEFLEGLDRILRTGYIDPGSHPPPTDLPHPQKGIIDGPPGSLEGYTIFHKAGPLAKLQKIHQPNGTLNFSRLRSPPPGYFSDAFQGLYLTTQKNLAWAQ